MALEGNIAIGAPSSIATPPAGEVTRFFNTDFSPPRLYYKDETGSVFVYPFASSSEAEDCCCEIAESMMDGLTCAVKNGMVEMTDYMAFIAQGVNITGSRTDDGAGNTTCSMVIAAANIPVVSMTTSPPSIVALPVGSQTVIVPTILPANATNKTVYYSSSNVAIAQVDSTGVVSGVGAGSCNIVATSADGAFTTTTPVSVV